MKRYIFVLSLALVSLLAHAADLAEMKIQADTTLVVPIIVSMIWRIVSFGSNVL